MRTMILLCSALVGAPLFAQAAVPLPSQTAQGDVAVTIYNNNRALIEDKRLIDLPRGRSRQEFRDVSAQIEPATVTLSGRGIGIVEQNFDFDLLSPSALMQKAVGQEVTLVRTNPGTGAETRERARILAVNGGVVMQIGDRIEVLRDDGIPARVIFDRVPPTLRPRPTLSITVDAANGGRQPVSLTYLTPGLGWAADYVALFDEGNGRMDVQGWITLTNNSGTPYVNASTMLVAGSVGSARGDYNEYSPPPPPPPLRRAGTETAARERLADFYLYPLPERTTIADKQTKQVSFLDVKGAPASRGYEYRNGWLQTADQPVSANSILRFSSSREQGLGDALPAGTVRVYQRDARGNPQFVGEHRIGHTPMGSDIGLATGQAFDIKVRPIVDSRETITEEQWKTTERFRIRNSLGQSVSGERDSLTQKTFYRTRMRYIVTNASPRAVTVDLTQSGLSWDTRISQESLPSEKLSADQVRWRVPVPANAETVVTATFDTRY
ncbi:DUF4139 domain-containing protein [Sphingomonas piscis]|uniref:DUF4139 domain-containing protein n=1 Tax=Sphingomonas piscis TaxID=2714943 RepID=A0A6G7YQ07_9SPHN|nr:DUF4139 domain-containing protein [Sphingomonas piscis]QIK78821.1 DUF4139 domain-containing protein [Sphingomonas piscis]